MIAAEAIPSPRPPCMVLAHPNPIYEAFLSRQFRLHGWEVCNVRSGREVRRLVHIVKPAVVVLATDLGTESGWLICAKLQRENPGLKVILVGKEPTAEEARFANFSGAAALVREDNILQTMLELDVEDTALPAVG